MGSMRMAAIDHRAGPDDQDELRSGQPEQDARHERTAQGAATLGEAGRDVRRGQLLR